ncbi:MAG: LamG-like jellyroll fold domain-containing protein [Verrucomicrobiota bacterium]
MNSVSNARDNRPNNSSNVPSPVIHWSFDGHTMDSFGKLNLSPVDDQYFSDSGINNSRAMLFRKDDKLRTHINSERLIRDVFPSRPHRFTISLWFKSFQGDEGKQTLIQINKPNRGSHLFTALNTLNLRVNNHRKDLTKSEVTLQSPFNQSILNHIVYRFDQGFISLFLNGEKTAETSLFLNAKKAREPGIIELAHKLNSIHLGSSMVPNPKNGKNMVINEFEGLMDEVKIYDQALDDEAIENLYQGLPPSHSLAKARESTSSQQVIIGPLANIPPSIEPILYFDFEDNRDSMSNRSLPQISPDRFLEEGIRKSTLYFDGSLESSVCFSSDRQTSDSDLLRYSYRYRTLSLWFKAEEKSDDMQSIILNGRPQNGFIVYLLGNQLNARTTTTTTAEGEKTSVNLKSPVSFNEWTHLVHRFSSGEVSLFINGKKVDTEQLEGITTISANHHMSFLGGVRIEEEIKFPYKGFIDNVKAYDIPLTEENIFRIYIGKNTIHQPLPEISYTPTAPPTLSDQMLREIDLSWDKAEDLISEAAFQPKPNNVPGLEVFDDPADIALLESTKEAVREKRILMGAIICSLGILVLIVGGIFIKMKLTVKERKQPQV